MIASTPRRRQSGPQVRPLPRLESAGEMRAPQALYVFIHLGADLFTDPRLR